jgi:hypothetical protein
MICAHKPLNGRPHAVVDQGASHGSFSAIWRADMVLS